MFGSAMGEFTVTNSTTSASCSIEPNSRKSESRGRLSSRCSTCRESWDNMQKPLDNDQKMSAWAARAEELQNLC